MNAEIAIKICLSSFQIIMEVLHLPVLFLRLFKTPKKCPRVKDEMLLLTATEVARRIRNKKITSVAVVEAYISRIKEVNPLINAVVEDRFQKALDEARKADDFVKNSGLDEDGIQTKYPLLGVPITIKGSIAVAGMNHSAGRADCQRKAKYDAEAVKHVRDAGAILLLISNTPELCLDWETSNKLIGTTSNPYNTTRTPGGSSGGEASLLGCGASLIGIGSDIGGSLRLPAHFCGVWGHKPSPNVVSTRGHYPDCKNRDQWNKVFTMGPMVRYATDFKLLLNVIAEPSMKKVLELDRPVEVKKIKVYYMDDPRSAFADNFDKDVVTAFRKTVAHFDFVCDTKCTKVRIPSMKHCALSYMHLLCTEEIEGILDNKENGYCREMLKFFIGQSKHDFISIFIEVFKDWVPFILGPSIQNLKQYLETLRNDFIKMLGDDGVFILPTYPLEATYTGDTLRRLFNPGSLSIFNSLGFPATSCPVMFSSNGMPLGIQVVAAPYLDRLNFCVAEEIERAFGGWKFI